MTGDLLLSILSVVAPVFLCAALGWAWARSGQPYDRGAITVLISTIGAPCLVFRNLSSAGAELGAMLEMSVAALLSIVVFTVLGYAILRLARLPTHTYLSPLVFANAGNLGLAVCRFAFPGVTPETTPGLALGITYFAVASFLNFTVGVAMWSGTLSPAKLARTPLVWAVAASVVVLALRIRLPEWLANTTQLLGDLSIPLMLLTLGVSLAELNVGRLPLTVALSIVRLGMGSAVGFALAALLDLEGAARGVLILQCSMPAAVFNSLFAEQYGRSPADVASMVVVSTLLSFVTLPLLLALLL
jgi:malate permease and related proteins